MAKEKVKTVPVMVRIPEDLLKKVDTTAVRDERSRAYVVVDSLKRRFARVAVAKSGVA